ncbi:MAG: tetratricopeptide repeat protein [Methanobacterium sp.]
MSKFQEADVILNKILESHPKDFFANYLKANLLSEFGEYNEMLDLLNLLLEEKLNEEQKNDSLNLKVSALLGLGRYDEAEDIVEDMLEENPDNEYALYYEAGILLITGYKSESIDYYKDSLKIVNEKLLKHQSIIKKIRISTDNRNRILFSLWLLKGSIQIRLHQYSEALESCDESLKINPNYYMSWNANAWVHAKLGEYDEALKSVNKSLELYPENAPASDTKGYILAESGNLQEALQYYEKAVEMDPLDEEICYHKGKAHQKFQQHTEALKCYNKVLELNPNCEYAKKARDEVLKLMEN